MKLFAPYLRLFLLVIQGINTHQLANEAGISPELAEIKEPA
ncbi:hypothetical protein ACFQNF_04485 [Iodobacter arcticus]|uniref:Uncharacterized protein n=1 Tax=Iodobacter arcticus TaxID=590593 RepID=A0ABW2QTR9_9NEIS